MNIDEYIEYLDCIIEEWLTSFFESEKLKMQLDFGNALERELYSDYLLNRLPEPYWGNPDSCSFVIMNYNPGPCNDSRHNYRYCADSNMCMINEIKKTKYSHYAKSFPLLRELNSTELWLADSIGRGWWQKQNDKWIKDLLNELYHGRNDLLKLPFAMELSAWHSKNWNGLSAKDRKKYKCLIDGMVFSPFRDAIKKSDFKFGLCFGSGFANFLNDYEKFCPNDDEFSKSSDERFGKSIYFFEKVFYIINFWDKKNNRNRYPNKEQDIFEIIHKLPIKSMLSRDIEGL